MNQTWNTNKLGDLLDEVDLRLKDLREDQREYLVLSLTKDNGLIPQKDRFDKQIATNDLSKYKVIKKGWIAYNPYVIWEGAIHMLKDDIKGLVSPAYVVLEVKNGDPKFIDYLLRSPSMLRNYLRISSGVVQRRRAVKKSSMLNLDIKLPSLYEQSAISKVLGKIDKAQRIKKHEFTLIKEIKSKLIDDLFQNGTAKEQLKESLLGNVPNSWEIVHFKEYIHITNGQVDPKKEPYKDMIHVGPENIESDSGILNAQQTNSELKIRSGNYFFTPENILYSKIRPYLNKVAIPMYSGTCSADMYPLAVDEKHFNKRFIYHYLLSNKFLKQAISFQGRTGIPKINREQLGSILILKPSLKEQQKIVEILDKFDEKLKITRNEIIILSELFNELMNKLYSGDLQLPKSLKEEN